MTTTSTTLFGVRPVASTKDDIISSRPRKTLNGVRFPLFDNTRPDEAIFGQTQGLNAAKAQVLQLFNTGGGERLMLPNFGVSFEQYLFEPLSEELATNIKNEALNALSEWIPEVEVLSVHITHNDSIGARGIPGILLTMSITLAGSDNQTDISVTL
tara:strand:+ start:179 stop:646 length:468 start_codon:yes stop_codon:yes gene_type:complete